jgi:hypothetical protein
VPDNLTETLDLVRAGDTAVLRLVRSGWDVNEPQDWTGTTALLAACSADRPEMIELLLRNGADPNVVDNDGYQCYDACRSRRARELLLAGGFSRRLGGLASARGVAHLRLLAAATPVTEEQSVRVAGTELHLEYRVQGLPEPSGRVRLTVTLDGTPVHTVALAGPGHRLCALPRAGEATATLAFEAFRGELDVRLYCADTIAGNAGPRSFWVPDWSAEPW